MKKGFTLIELLVVVLIIGILASIALPQYTKAVEKSRTAEALIMLKNITDAANRYYLQHGSYVPDGHPMNFEDLDIDIPNVNDFSNAWTKNFKYAIAAQSSNSLTLTATYGSSLSGKYYKITYFSSLGGLAERRCEDSDSLKTCKAFGASSCSSLSCYL
ncbi:type IV pilus assembly protein PilE [Elusimicrobium posterum]|uniref:type IV pilin protein n=1 Tax=Elusimicrobium posterum TaxID=3116653 RepID=UPI003C725180